MLIFEYTAPRSIRNLLDPPVFMISPAHWFSLNRFAIGNPPCSAPSKIDHVHNVLLLTPQRRIISEVPNLLVHDVGVDPELKVPEAHCIHLADELEPRTVE
jgi:hypothetical protein